MNWDQDLDALGLLCPLPVLKAAKRLRAMAPGEILRIQADDPAAEIDVPHFCAEQGYAYLGSEAAEVGQVYYVQKAEKAG
jgi:tRNA 2-thiouridine synthesizing protein A